jgi:histidine triad (HIT) family protein
MCVFCKIAAGEISCTKVYEDEHVLAFLDISPVTQGHTLIIPKRHVDDFTHCPSDLVARMHGIARKLTQHYDSILKPNGYHFLSNAKPAAGQSVFHVHFHLIPRYDGTDGLDFAFRGTDAHKLDAVTQAKLHL